MIGAVIGLASLAVTGLQAPGTQPPGPPASPPRPAMRQGGSIGAADYPREALRLHQEGKAVVTVHVNAKGRVSACSVAQSSGSDSLDAASCSFVRRVRFDPARDENGRPVEGDARFPMSWHLPTR